MASAGISQLVTSDYQKVYIYIIIYNYTYIYIYITRQQIPTYPWSELSDHSQEAIEIL